MFVPQIINELPQHQLPVGATWVAGLVNFFNLQQFSAELPYLLTK
jgi:hypothetical protein